MKKHKGFSIVELLVVVAILGAVAAIAVPYLLSYRDNARLKEATRDIASDIQYYKQKAVAENIKYRIVFSANNNNYAVQYLPAASWVNVETKTAGKGNAEIRINGDPTFTDDTITIQVRGTTNAGTLELKHMRRLSTAKVVTNSIGRVRTEYELK